MDLAETAGCDAKIVEVADIDGDAGINQALALDELGAECLVIEGDARERFGGHRRHRHQSRQLEGGWVVDR